MACNDFKHLTMFKLFVLHKDTLYHIIGVPVNDSSKAVFLK